jgi:signal peptidase
VATAISKLSSVWKSSYLKSVILAVIIIGGVIGFWFGLRAALGNEYPLLTVASGSMIPTLNVGDLIVVQGVSNASSLHAASRPDGDIVIFRSPRTSGELIVHRVVDKEMHNGLWYFQTQGDNNGGPDFWVGSDTFDGRISQSLIIGKVIGKVPYVGYIPLYIRTPVGIAFIIILILIIVFAEYIPTSPKEQSGRD